MGAADVAAKPVAHGFPQLQAIADELMRKISAAADIDPRRLRVRTSVGNRKPFGKLIVGGPRQLPIVVIASSTGGPMALRYVIPRLPTELAAWYVVVQHLPVGFTATMARDLDRISEISVREAVAGDKPESNIVLLAPSGKHCCLGRNEKITLTEEPSLWGVRPAADITMTSAAAVFGHRVIGVVLTGMGRDGAHGTQEIKSRGGTTLAEDESSCVIYGMPRAAIATGAVDVIVPLEGMPEAIAAAVNRVGRFTAKAAS
jgi:two-component system chemotaxis response regulator CheB